MVDDVVMSKSFSLSDTLGWEVEVFYEPLLTRLLIF